MSESQSKLCLKGLSSEARKRLVWVSVFVFSLFCLLILQFFKIQIIQGEKWSAQATSQHQLVVTEPFKRGLFYSNTSIKLGHPETAQAFVSDVLNSTCMRIQIRSQKKIAMRFLSKFAHYSTSKQRIVKN